MPRRRLTLWIARDTDVPSVVARLEAELLRAGVCNPALIDLVRETCARFQRDLMGQTHGRAAGASTELTGETYRVRITTRRPARLVALCDRLLPWQASFS